MKIALLFLITCFALVQPTVGAASGLVPNCADLFEVKPQMELLPFRERVVALRKAYDDAEAREQFVESAQAIDEVAAFAGELIRSHRNQELFELYATIKFPLNKLRYEDSDHFFPFARHLLEDAILSKNFVAYDWLRSQPNQHARIGAWNRELTGVVAETPYFSKDVPQIRAQTGRYDVRLMNVGYMTKHRLEALAAIREKPNVAALFSALEDVFPNGELETLGIQTHGAKTRAQLEFVLPCHCGVGADDDAWIERGDEKKTDRWLHVGIYDSKYYKQGWFHGRYTRVAKFNLPVTNDNSTRVKELEIRSDRVRILIERDKNGMSYDRGTKFQELTLFYHPQTMRIDMVKISNGNSRIFNKKLGWNTQFVEIPETIRSFNGVYFVGYEDLSTLELRPRASDVPNDESNQR